MTKRIVAIVAAVLMGGAAMAQTEGTAAAVDNAIYTVVEHDPEFPGGMDALVAWVGSHVEYPAEAREAGLQGTVFVTFVVERDGSITNVRVVAPKEKMALLEEEAVRVVRAMPKWKPGKVRGKKVRVQFNLPIQFTL